MIVSILHSINRCRCLAMFSSRFLAFKAFAGKASEYISCTVQIAAEVWQLNAQDKNYIAPEPVEVQSQWPP